MNKKIILDTNFLLIPGQFKVDIFSEIERISHFPYKLFIVDRTLDELEGIIASQKGKDKNAARLAIQLINRYNISIISSDKGHVDTTIVEIADKDTIVATQDIELIKKLKKKGVHIIRLRSKSHLKIM